MYRPHPLVLCYHAVSSSWPSSLAMPEQLLESQLSILRRRGYVGLTLAAAERARAAGTLPRRTVVVTFDDGYASTLRAKPVLDSLGFPATVFVVTSFVEANSVLSWPGIEHWTRGEHAHELRPLGWSDLEVLWQAGWEIGSHTVTHPRLPELAGPELEEQLVASREAIARRVGACETIAYPYGLADSRVAAAAARAGYIAGVTLTSAHRADEPLLRPRTGLYPGDSGVRLQVKLSPLFGAFRRTALAKSIQRARDSLGKS